MKPWAVAAGIVLTTAIILGLVVVGCGGGGGGETPGPGTPEPLTEQEIAAIERDSAAITTLVSEDGIRDVDDVARQAEQLPSVEWARADASAGMTVQYRGGGLEVWPEPAQFADSLGSAAADLSRVSEALVSTSEAVGSRSAMLFNALAADPALAYVNYRFNSVESLLRSAGFSVARRDGNEAHREALLNLAGTGAVFVLGHGGPCFYSDAPGDVGFCLQTGERFTSERDWTGERLADWRAKRLVFVRIGWDGSGCSQPRKMVGVTDRFFSHYYGAGRRMLNHALFFNGACSGLANNSLARALNAAGVACYMGYTDSQRVSPDAMLELASNMARGASVQESLSVMSPGLVRDRYTGQCDGVPHDARLSLYPANAGSLQLRDLQQGYAAFKVTLTWDLDNDIDLHVFHGVSEHAYYANRTISIGYLDRDDTDGYGPEHFYATGWTPGTYYLVVNYYADPRADESRYGLGRLTNFALRVDTPSTSLTWREFVRYPNHNSGYPFRYDGNGWRRTYQIRVLNSGQVVVENDPATVWLGQNGTVSGPYALSVRHLPASPIKPYELDGVASDPSLRRYAPAAGR